MFLIDLRRDLLEKQAEKFRTKGQKINAIFNHFIDEVVAASSNRNDANEYAKMQA
jgi:hypothetical protein